MSAMQNKQNKPLHKSTKNKPKQKPTSNKDIENFINEQVMNRLGGKPKNFNFIKASNIFDNNWRVDIWCTKDVDGTLTSIKDNSIKYSYFVKADSDGKIISSDPEITIHNKFNIK